MLVATTFGLGRWPWGPGTLTSAAVAAVVYLLGPPAPLGLLLAGVVVGGAGVYAAGAAEIELGRDAGAITVDEAAGMLLTLAFAPPTAAGFGAAFLFFRAFDILKPQPVFALQALAGGAGVVADDVAAGLYAGALLFLPRVLGLHLPWLFGSS